MAFTCDVVVIGAGAAGLSALRDLRAAGLNAVCVEARDRIGGRILTIHDPLSPLPIELGAEFIHGIPPEIWELARQVPLKVVDCEENAVHFRNGKSLKKSDAWEQIDDVTEDMKRLEAKGKDITCERFFASRSYNPEVVQMATNFIEGFNAARKEVVGIASLAKDARASEEIEGDRNFRILDGYSRVPQMFAAGVEQHIYLNEVVEEVEWRKGSAVVRSRSALTESQSEWHARAAVMTLPLGVLQAGDVRFSPQPAGISEAANGLAFGSVFRVVFRFREAWWEKLKTFRDAGFWLSTERTFPTWWTKLPVRAPILVGWSAGPHTDSLLNASFAEVVEAALQDLARVTKEKKRMLEEKLAAAYFHNWSADPFARGAYSYVPAGGLQHRTALAQPVEKTLFFSGEATELEGHSATVHGAIASGRRSARDVIAVMAKRDGKRGRVGGA